VDFVRSRRGKHLRLSVDPVQPRRGEWLWARVDPEHGKRAGERLELGLRCRVRYEEETINAEGNHYPRTRTATAWEGWVEATPGLAVPLAVPRDQPYSYDGELLSFSWDVLAREEVASGLDAVAKRKLWVRP
jgi:hypothetical protein